MQKMHLILTVVVAVAAAFLVRMLWPKTVTVHTPPEIVTVWDTVAVFDTVELVRWRERTRTVTDTVNLIRTVTVTQLDTVYVLPPTYGMVGLDVQGQAWGDTMVMRGFVLEGDTTAIRRRDWRSTAFVAGPLRTVVVDSLPPAVEFWPMPGQPCGFWCKAKITALAGTVGAGIAAVACVAR